MSATEEISTLAPIAPLAATIQVRTTAPRFRRIRVICDLTFQDRLLFISRPLPVRTPVTRRRSGII